MYSKAFLPLAKLSEFNLKEGILAKKLLAFTKTENRFLPLSETKYVSE